MLFQLLIPLLLFPCGHAAAAKTLPSSGAVSGCVEITGHSAYHGVAALWPAEPGQAPDPRRAIRPPLVSSPLDPSGCFALQAAPGTYFVGAVVRLSEGGWQGPPRIGDWVFLSPDSVGDDLQVTLHSGVTVDIGRHGAGWPYAGFGTDANALTIAGRLSDGAGRPLAGLLVFAFTDSAMSAEPLAVSEPSDSEGRYLLRLPAPATVYLRARAHYGRRNPADGGYMGVYGGRTAQPVRLSKVDRLASGCDLTVLLIPAQGKRTREK